MKYLFFLIAFLFTVFHPNRNAHAEEQSPSVFAKKIISLYDVELNQMNTAIVPDFKIDPEPYIGYNAHTVPHTLLFTDGFVRSTGGDPELLALFICHELGHFFIGPSEGFADYFATADCLKRALVKKVLVHQNSSGDRYKNQCSDSKVAINTCVSYLEIGEKISHFLEAKSTSTLSDEVVNRYLDSGFSSRKIEKSEIQAPQINRSESLVIHQTLTKANSYPTNQCRLDTFISGAMCASSELKWNDAQKTYDFVACLPGAESINKNSSLRKMSGFLPKCWYNDSTTLLDEK